MARVALLHTIPAWLSLAGSSAWILLAARHEQVIWVAHFGMPTAPATLGVLAVAAFGTLAVAAAFTASAIAASTGARSNGARSAAGLWLTLGFLVNLLPARALLADGALTLAVFSASAAAAGLVAAVWTICSGRVVGIVAASSAAALAWAVPLLFDVGSAIDSSLWMLLVVTAYPVFLLLAAFGVAETAERRLAATDTRRFAAVGMRVLMVVLAVKVVLLVARLTVARELFGTQDAQLWALRSWTSWPHAVAVAGLFVLLAWRSWTCPVTRRGQRFVTICFTVGAASVPAAVLADQVMSAATTAGPLVGVSDALLGVQGTSVPFAMNAWFYNTSHWWAVAIAVVALAVVGLPPAFRRSAGKSQALLGVLYLLPSVLAIAVLNDHPDLDLPTVWSSPVQVDVALTAIVAVLVAASLVARRTLLPTGLAIRLLVSLFFAIHAAVLLPALLDDALGHFLVIGGSLFAVIAASVSATRRDSTRHLDIVNASWRQAAVLVLFVLVLSVGLDGSGATDLLAVLWLAVPVSLGICLKIGARRTPSRP